MTLVSSHTCLLLMFRNTLDAIRAGNFASGIPIIYEATNVQHDLTSATQLPSAGTSICAATLGDFSLLQQVSITKNWDRYYIMD